MNDSSVLMFVSICYLVSPGYPLLLPCRQPQTLRPLASWVLLGRNTLGKAEALRVHKALGRFLPGGKKSTNCWDDLRVKEHVKYACTPLLGYPTTMCPCLTMQVPFLHASDPMNLRGVFVHVFQNYHLLREGGSPSTNGKKLFAAWLPANDHLRSWRKGSRTCENQGLSTKKQRGDHQYWYLNLC